MTMIDVRSLGKMLPMNKHVTEWCELLNEMLPAYNITTPERISAFIAQCSHESTQFCVLEENLYYSEKALLKLFGKYFEGKDVSEYAKQPEKIANVIYANRMGNGDTESGDGYRFRGRGVIQLTGKYNYEKFGESVGKPLDEVIDYLQTKRGALHSALWFWDMRNLNPLADEEDIEKITRKINGGLLGLTERIENYEHMHTLLTQCSDTKEEQVFKTTLKLGSKGKDVACLQSMLGIDIDGLFGQETTEAVVVFQLKHGLTPDGIVGYNTFTKLQEIVNS